MRVIHAEHACSTVTTLSTTNRGRGISQSKNRSGKTSCRKAVIPKHMMSVPTHHMIRAAILTKSLASCDIDIDDTFRTEHVVNAIAMRHAPASENGLA